LCERLVSPADLARRVRASNKQQANHRQEKGSTSRVLQGSPLTLFSQWEAIMVKCTIKSIRHL
jgi:hypothetical protein